MKTLLFTCIGFVVATTLYANPIPSARPDHGPEDPSVLPCTWLDIYLSDSYGDGWNGAYLYIYDWNSNLIASTTLSSGYGTWYSLCLTPGCYTIEVTEGGYPWEISWTAYEDFGPLLAYGYAPDYASLTLGTPVYGCTFLYSCNYDPNATCDDGSCSYENTAYLYLYDSFGDGWGTGYISIRDNDYNYYYSSTLPSGSYAEESFCIPDGCYVIEVSGGEFPADISWSLYASPFWNYSLDFIASGLAPETKYAGVGGTCDYSACANPNACNYSTMAVNQSGDCCMENCGIVYMYDSFGDGWSGAEFSLTNWKGQVVDHGTLYYGAEGIELTCLPDGCYDFHVSSGSWASDVSWYYTDVNNFEYGTAGQSVTLEVGTIVPGCTDAAAVNYNPAATCSDSCVYTCTSDLDGNGVVNVNDLLIFTADFGLVCY